MNILNLVSGIAQPLHAMNEQRDNMTLVNCEKFTSQMYFHVPNVPMPPSVIAKEKRRMVAENGNEAMMYALMRQ